ncbi:MAG TPA: zinc ribbon domain-containing protein [Melioribacteraceae bacterium]|nr:zinc ribbon domain-containing protein [Melioribacteraceae bacterium]
MICSSCKKQIPDNSVFCPICGYTINGSVNTSNFKSGKTNFSFNNNSLGAGKKSPIIALLLSLLVVGLGQFYLGYVKKGFIMLGLAIFFSLFSFGLAWFAVAIWSAVDAYSTAKKL